MHQISLRAPDELVDRVRDSARAEGISVNSFIVHTLDAATTSEHLDDLGERMRERLRRAGLLEEPGVYDGPVPDPALVARAGRRAGRGKPLSDYVSEGRD